MKIITYPNPILREKSKKVLKIDASILKFIKSLVETLRNSYGVGLSAPQVGKLLKIIVIELKKEKENDSEIPLTILINPKITFKSKEKETQDEGCLSLPNIWGPVKRSVKIVAQALNEKGEIIEIKAQGLLARVIQHEIDHLNGILFIDRVKDKTKLYKLEENGQNTPIQI